MPDSGSGGEPIFSLPISETPFEDEHGRTRLFEPRHAKLVETLTTTFPPIVHCLYLLDTGEWLLVAFSFFERLTVAIMPDRAELPKGRFLSRDEAIDWLLKHRREIPEWLDISDRRVPRLQVQPAKQKLIEHQPAATDASPADAVPCLVTLKQMAAIVNRTKRTLERLRNSGGLPEPSVKGGSGRPDEWNWEDVRPILEKKYFRHLPARFPGDQFIR